MTKKLVSWDDVALTLPTAVNDKLAAMFDVLGAATTAQGAAATDATNKVAGEAVIARAAEGLKLVKASNLADLTDSTAARLNLGLGTAATHATGDYDAAGAAAAVTPATLGLGSVNNTADSAKPVSAAQAAADAAAIAAAAADAAAKVTAARVVPRWAPTTVYTLGQQVVSPGNDVVSAIAAHTSGATYTPANWSGSSTYAPVGVVVTGVEATDTAAIQAAHDALPARGGLIQLRAGVYAIAAAGLTFTKQVTLAGAGGTLSGDGATIPPRALTTLTYSSATGTAITLTAVGCILKDFALVNSSGTAPTAGSGIDATAAGNAGSQFRMTGVTVLGFYDLLRVSGVYYMIDSCHFYDAVRWGIFASTTDPAYYDHGDQGIINCVFVGLTTNRSGAAAVRWESGGGIRFTGNKINGLTQPGNASVGSWVVGFDACVADGTSTSVLVVTGNSIEGCTDQMILVRQKGTTGTFSKVVVVGNEIAISGTPLWPTCATAGQISDVLFSGNVCTDVGNMVFAQRVKGLVVGPNRLTRWSTAAIRIDAECSDYQLEIPHTTGAGTLLSDMSVDANSHNVAAKVNHHYVREIPTTTSPTTFTPLYKFSLVAYQSAIINVRMVGTVSTVGTFAIDATRLLVRGASGNVTVTTIGTDTTAGAAVQFAFDVTAVAGEVLVKVASPLATSKDVAGIATVKLDGSVNTVVKS